MANKPNQLIVSLPELGRRLMEFVHGNALLQITSPVELYLAQRFFRYTSYNLFNTTFFNDDSLISAVAVSKQASLLDISAAPNLDKMGNEDVHTILLGICTDYVSGKMTKKAPTYPMYLMVGPEGKWDDSEYEVDPGIKKVFEDGAKMHQIKAVHVSGDQLLKMDSLNGLKLTNTLTQITPYEINEENMNIRSTLGNIEYPVAKLYPFACTIRDLLISQRDFETVTTNKIGEMVQGILAVLAEKFTESELSFFVEKMAAFNSGMLGYTIHTDEELSSFFEFQDLFLMNNPPYVENNFPLTLAAGDMINIGLVDPEKFICVDAENQIEYRVIDFSEVIKYTKAFVDAYNDSITYIYDVIRAGGVNWVDVPAKLTMRLRQAVINDMMMQYQVEHPEEFQGNKTEELIEMEDESKE